MTPTMKQVPYELIMGDQQTTRITKALLNAHLTTKTHQEQIDLDIIGVATHDIILGLPWLRKHNPQINWAQNTLSMDACNSTHRVKPTRMNAPVDEKTTEYLALMKTRPYPGSRFCQWQSQGHEQSQTRINTRNSAPHTGTEVALQTPMDKPATGLAAPHDIPNEYRRWTHLFQEVNDKSALPKHKAWDHEIPLRPGTQPKTEPLRPKLAEELEEIKKFIDKNLARGYIRASTSPAGYNVLFVDKKDGKKRPCID